MAEVDSTVAAAAAGAPPALSVVSPITAPIVAQPIMRAGERSPGPIDQDRSPILVPAAPSRDFTPRRPLSRKTSKEVLSTSPLRLHHTESGGGVASPAGDKFLRMNAHVTTTTTTTATGGVGGPQTLISPLRRGVRAARPLSRESSKEALQAHYTDPLSASTTTTSIFQHHSPHPPGAPFGSNSPSVVHSPAGGATMISTTTSYTHLHPSALTLDHVADTKLPSVTIGPSSSSTSASVASLSATLLAASKDSINLPAIVSAHAGRLAHLETLTHTQADSILELQQIVRNLQKQLVMVMQYVPSTSGTGGVAAVHLASPPSYPRVSSDAGHSSSAAVAGAQHPYRSRSNTELRERALMAKSVKRSSAGNSGGTNTPRTPSTPSGSGGAAAQQQAELIVSHLHFGAHTDSTESLPSSGLLLGLGHPPGQTQTQATTARSSKGSSRANSRYASPRNGGAKAHSTKTTVGSHQPTTMTTTTTTTPSSHHFSFHHQPTTLTTQAPPGQIQVEPVYPVGVHGGANGTSKATSAKRNRIQSHTLDHGGHESRLEGSARNPSRRLSPVEAFMAREEFHQQPHLQQQHPHQHPPPPQMYAQPQQHSQHPHPIASYPSMPTHSPYTYHAVSPPTAAQSAYGGLDRAHSIDYSAAPPPPPTSAIGSLDPLRPLPMQHIVTQGKSGMTEYVLSFRDGEEPVATPGGGVPEYSSSHDQPAGGGVSSSSSDPHHHYRQASYDHGSSVRAASPSPRSAAVEQWKAMHAGAPTSASAANVFGTPGGAAAGARAGREKDKKEKKKKKDKEPPAHAGAASVAPALPYTPTLQAVSSHADGGPSSPRRHPAQHTHVSSGVDASAAKEAERRARRGTKEKKVCKVAGCEEPRIGVEKYCKAHAGPAPINPNARKMMFQH